MGYGHGIVEGKHVGYNICCHCEYSGCKEKINRGLAYKCGGNIGSGEGFCNGFFCSGCLYFLGMKGEQVCKDCANDVARIKHKKLPFPWLRRKQ